MEWMGFWLGLGLFLGFNEIGGWAIKEIAKTLKEKRKIKE